MKLFAETALRHIVKQIEGHTWDSSSGNRLLCMTPSMPIEAVYHLGCSLQDYCAENEPLAPPLIRIAAELCDEWRSSDDPATRDRLARVEEKGWPDNTGNLTSYRNERSPAVGPLVVLLVGTDRVTDAASLADFHQCDYRTIWEAELGRSFAEWSRSALESARVGFEDETVEHFDEVLVPLVERGLADIVQVSLLLEQLELSNAQDGREAENVLLQGLARFNLPSFIGFQFGGRRSFGPYVENAVAFFSYDAFLEDRSRKRAAKAVDNFMKHNTPGELFDQSERGPFFDSDDKLLNALKQYIETGDREARDRLLQCDFVTIHDRILEFKPPREESKRKRVTTVRKLSGGPVEVVLTAVWQTLSDFPRAAVDAGVFAHEALSEIRIRSELFKHDSDGATEEERHQRARAYIARLMGGLDHLLKQGLRLPRSTGEDEEVAVSSELVQADLDCQSCRSGEPFLQFSVALTGEGFDEPVVRHFAWRLPDIQPYRIADELIQWAARGISEAEGYCLPAFHAPYYEELMLAKDGEETRRVLRHCIQGPAQGVSNLLDASDIDRNDPLLPRIEKLAYEYDVFIQAASKKGLHAAILSGWDDLRRAYEKACDAYVGGGECAGSSLAALLFRAFLFIRRRPEADGDRWVWEKFEPSAAVTVLHPALLEMLQAHNMYLLSAFASVASRQLRASSSQAFRYAIWQNYLDLAAIHMPLCGILGDRNKVLDTSVRGEGLFHTLGSAGDAEASLTTRLLLRYDTSEEEELSDSELFKTTRESTLLARVLADYRRLHPHANDGLSIAVYQNQDVQPVIAAVDSFLSEACADRTSAPSKYSMAVTLFTESSDDTSVARWISQWRERWEAAETDGKLAHYRQSRLSLAHRIVSPSEYYSQFRQLIADGLQVDIAILNGFIEAGAEGNEFARVDPYDVTSRTLKFPVLEKPFCALRDPGRQLHRARVLSNRQFRIGSRHAEIMARLKNPSTQPDAQHVVLGFGDYTPWQGVVDALHQQAEWVVCVDPNVDERLIAEKGTETHEAREIIGFGSGVGSHGEANYTISTEQFRLSDVLERLTASVAEVYAGWDQDVYRDIAQGVLKEARRLSGLSLVRATGIGDYYIRNFMAYALSRKALCADGDVLCDQLVTLDAYQHWFETAESDTRPDLLWVVARMGEDDRVHLDLRLIECKLARTSDLHLEKARVQVENGLRHLVAMFRPRDDIAATEDDRPDQRYWWLQLHRLIASRAEIDSRNRARVLAALERLADGDYRIEWRAAAVAFWTDQPLAEMELSDEWHFSFDSQELYIGVVSAGRELVRRVCAEDAECKMPWSESSIRFNAQVLRMQPGDSGAGRAGDSGGETTQKEGVDASLTTDVVGVSATSDRRAIPDRILLGTASQGARPVYWEFGHPELSNRHMLIFGTSGMGKTYAVQCMLCELAKHDQNSLIIDYTNGFLPNQLEPETEELLRPEQHVIRRSPLPINPFRLQSTDLGGTLLPESESTAAKRIASIFQSVYDLGEQQFSVLFDAIVHGLSEHGESMSLDHLLDILADFTTDETKNKSATQTTLSKIRPFVMDNPFQPGTDAWDWSALFADPSHRCHVFQLAGLDPHTWRLATEFTLWDFYAFLQSCSTKDDVKVLVLDEVQNLDQREGSPLSKYLREGRKFGVSLIMATQIMSNLNRDERDRLFNAGHKLFFRPSDTEVRTYANIASVFTNEKAETWARRLAGLGKGECYSLGPSLNESTGALTPKAFRIKISPLAERGRDA